MQHFDFSTESEDCVNNNKTKRTIFIPRKDLPTPPSDHNEPLSASMYFRSSEEVCGTPGTAFLSAPLSPPDTTGSATPPSGASTPAISNERTVFPTTAGQESVAATLNSGKKSTTESAITFLCCKWLKCGACVQNEDLVDHVKEVHVDPQKDPTYSPPGTRVKSQVNPNGSTNPGSIRTRSSRHRNIVSGTKDTEKEEKPKKFVCLWEGCKVYNVPSCSFSWIDRHFLSHCGDKPFKCIVDGCGQRFPTQGSLERHVNSHFNTYQIQQTQRPNKSVETISTPTKSIKRRKVRKNKRSSCISESHTVFIFCLEKETKTK